MAPSIATTSISTKMEKKKKEGGAVVAVVDEKKTEVAVVSKLDRAQILKGSRALLKYVENKRKDKKANGDGKLGLLESDDEDEVDADGKVVTMGSSGKDDTVWLVVTTKKFVTDKRKLKPGKITLPYPLASPTAITACLIVKDPQRTYKDLLLPSSPTVQKVIDITHLRKKYKTFETRRQLRDSYDMFLADDRIMLLLRRTLGSTFLDRTKKIPIPVSIADTKSPEKLHKEIEKAVRATYLHLSPNSGMNIRVGRADFSPEQLVENIEKVTTYLTGKTIPGGWKGVRSIYIKTSDSVALPIYLPETLFEEKDVKTVEDFEKEKAKSEEMKTRREERLKKRREKALKMKGSKEDENKKKEKRKAEESLEKDDDADEAEPAQLASPATKKQKIEKKAKKDVASNTTEASTPATNGKTAAAKADTTTTTAEPSIPAKSSKAKKASTKGDATASEPAVPAPAPATTKRAAATGKQAKKGKK